MLGDNAAATIPVVQSQCDTSSPGGLKRLIQVRAPVICHCGARRATMRPSSSCTLRPCRVAARSLQVHETARIYGRGVQLARFPFAQRILWTLLLWSARFAWGQGLIRRLRRNR